MHVTVLNQSDLLKCPFVILMPEHYRRDGSCRCNDPEHTAMVWNHLRTSKRYAANHLPLTLI